MKKITIPSSVEYVMSALSDAGHDVYLVGGCVRDSLLGLEPKDYDMTTDATVDEIKELYNKKHCKVYINNMKKHGTVLVRVKGTLCEISTFKSSYNQKTIRTDLDYRDLTINAIACDKYGSVVYNDTSLSDLSSGVIRAVGNPCDRFSEDPLRILRALRFASVYGFNIEAKTKETIFNMKEELTTVSAERISKEFNAILTGKNCFNVLKEYRDVIAVFIPEIKIMFDYNQNSKYHPNDLYIHTLNVVKNTEAVLPVRLAAFFHDIGKPDVRTFSKEKDGTLSCHYRGHSVYSNNITEEILHRLKYSKKEIAEICFLVLYHDFVFTGETNNLKKLFKLIGSKVAFLDKSVVFDRLLDLRQSDRRDHDYSSSDRPLVDLDKVRELGHKLLETFNKTSKLAINGNDLIELGYKGKEIGDCLNDMTDAVLDEKLSNDKDSLMTYAKEKNKN